MTAGAHLDAEVARRYEALYSPLVSDCAEALGLGPRAVGGLQPFHTDQLRAVVGLAHTCQVEKTDEWVEIDTLLAMVDATPTSSVVVVAADEDVDAALWGGLMTAGVQTRGAVGAVVNGGVRDLEQIVPQGFPVFAAYRSPLDIRGRGGMVGFGDPVTFRGVPVAPGDLVFGDASGVVFVPQEAALEVLALCEDRLAGEQATAEELRAGADATQVYSRHRAF